MLAPMIEVADDGKTATGKFCLVCMLTMLDDQNKEDAYIEIGKYTNKYVKVNGKWLFQELTGDMEKAAPWDKGWVKSPMTKDI